MALKINNTTVANDTPSVAWSTIRANTIPPFVQSITINGTGTASAYVNCIPTYYEPLNPVYSIAFKSDGTKMFLLFSTSRVFEYNLSTPWAVNSQSFTAGANVSVSTEAPTAFGLAFKPDGTKMYITGDNATDQVFEYSLSTPWQVNTATFTSGANISVNAQETQTYGVAFSNTGAKMYIVGRFNDRVFEYALSTPWQVNTATATAGANVAVADTLPGDIRFNSNGTIMYIAATSANKLLQYNLSTAWQVNTATIVSNIDLSLYYGGSSLKGLGVSADDMFIYSGETTSGRVYMHQLESAGNVASVGHPTIVFTRL